MKITYNSKSHILAQRWRKELQNQHLPADTSVMSVRDFANHYQVASATADRVFKLLTEENFIYRIPRKGAFLRHAPPATQMLGFSGPVPSPDHENVLYKEAFRQCCHNLAVQQHPLRFIAYHELQQPKLAAEKLSDLDGFLLEACFIDSLTLPALQQFHGRIVVTGACYIIDEFPCSQVIPDFRSGLLQLAQQFDLSVYENFLVVTASHRNALIMQKQLFQFFAEQQIRREQIKVLEFVTDGSLSAESQAMQYFSNKPGSWDKTLIVTLSDYFSFGIQEAFREHGSMPDIFSIDNLEDFLPALDNNRKFFTSIDKSMSRIYCEAADLLLRLLTSQDDRNYIISIPTSLVPRESLHCPRLPARH